MNFLCDMKDVVNAFKSYEPKPISEAGKRLVTCHGDWHTGNMLTREDGSVIAIDLEMVFVGHAHLDAAYFVTQAHLSRAQIFEYAEQYLKSSQLLDFSEKSIREFVFDIEQAKIFCMIVGLSSLEEQLKQKYKVYKGGFLTDALTLLGEAQSDKAKFDLVVDNGLYHAMFKNNSKLFAGLMEKYSKDCWYFNPDFDKEHTIYDRVFA